MIYLKPGRVVTLIQSNNPESKVFGMGYRINSKDKESVLNYLDYREQNGYTRYQVKFYPNNLENTKIVDITLYVADNDNESYAGETSTSEIVEQIFNAKGKSGPNPEYVYKLADAMRNLYPSENDEHLFELEKLLKQKTKLNNNLL